jgi:hypothetical protein
MSQYKIRSPRRNERQATSRMGWSLGLGMVLVIGAGFLAFRGPGPGGEVDILGTPQLKADKQTIDLGNVPLGQTVSVTFELRNDGDRTLLFQESPYFEVVEAR